MTSSSSGVRSERCSACPSATQAVQAPAKQSACVSSWMLRPLVGEAEPALHGVPELVGHDHRAEEAAVVRGQLLEQRPVVDDQVAGRVVVRVPGDLVGLRRRARAADSGIGVGALVDGVRVDGEVAVLQRGEVVAEELGVGLRPEGVQVGERVAGELVDRIGADPGDREGVGRDVDRFPPRPGWPGRRPADRQQPVSSATRARASAGGTRRRTTCPTIRARTPLSGEGRSGSRLARAIGSRHRMPAPGRSRQVSGARDELGARPGPGTHPSCRNQTVPSGGAATVAEAGWPCRGSARPMPPKLPTPSRRSPRRRC